MTLVGSGANILAYAKAWEAQHARDIALDDITRSWRGVPTRIQVRDQRRIARERAVQARADHHAAQAMGMAL